MAFGLSILRRRPDWRLLGLGIVLPAVAYVGAFLLTDGFGRVGRGEPRPSFSGEHVELVVALVSARFCGANRVEGFREAIPPMLALLKEQAVARESRFRSVGISIDWDARVGVNYLRGLGEFDELVAGGNWLNAGTEQYVWGGVGAEPTIPQVLVLQRVVSGDSSSLAVGEEQLLKAVVGGEEIVEWVQAGARLRGS